jgi:DNA-binding Lrp family transcriptional regulator
MANDSVVNLTHDQIAEFMGISKRVVQRHLKILQSYRVGDETLIRAERTAEGYSYVVTAITVKRGTMPTTTAPTKKTKAPSPTNEIFDYWLRQYHEAYGEAYQVSNFGKEKGHVRTLATRYGGDVDLVKAIIDVVIRLYPTKWKSAQFMRPTLGALVSWLALQAEPLAKANLQAAADADVVITSDDGLAVFDAYDKKWGLD